MGGFLKFPTVDGMRTLNVRPVDDTDVIDSLRNWEGFIPHPRDIGDGVLTLGSGLTNPKWIKQYIAQGNTWSEKDNRKAMIEEVAGRRKRLEELVPRWNEYPEDFQKALISYYYNYEFNRANSPKMFEAMDRFDLPEVINQMDASSKNPDLKTGVDIRRAKERAWARKGLEKMEEEAEQRKQLERKPFSFAINKAIDTLRNSYVPGAGGRWAYGGPVNTFGNGGDRKSWKEQHLKRWHDFLVKKGVEEGDAQRLAGFFTAQDGLESAGGQSSAARQKNNFGGMQRGGKNITYDSPEAYMEDKWSMMNRRFKPALSAQSIDEYATILGDPATAGKGYLYYVTDKAAYDPKSPEWIAAQTKHMQNYINGMRAWAGQGRRQFADVNIPQSNTPVIRETPAAVQDTVNRPLYVPMNPDVFENPLATYERPERTVELEQPLVQAAEEYTYDPAAERREGLRRLGLVMSILNRRKQESPTLDIFSKLSSLSI